MVVSHPYPITTLDMASVPEMAVTFDGVQYIERMCGTGRYLFERLLYSYIVAHAEKTCNFTFVSDFSHIKVPRYLSGGLRYRGNYASV